MKNCKKCGKQNFDEAIYCNSCGNKFEPDQEPKSDIPADEISETTGNRDKETSDGSSTGLTIFLIIFALVMIVVLLKNCTGQKKVKRPDPTPNLTYCIPSNIETASDKFFAIAKANMDDPKKAVEEINKVEIPKCMALARYYFVSYLMGTTETTMVIQMNNYLEEVSRLMKCAPNCD